MVEQPKEIKQSRWRSFFDLFSCCSWKFNLGMKPGQQAQGGLNFNRKGSTEIQLPTIKMFETTVNLDTNREDTNTTFKVTQNIDLADSLNAKTSNISCGNTEINMGGKASNSEFIFDKNIGSKKVDAPGSSLAIESHKTKKSHVRSNSS